MDGRFADSARRVGTGTGRAVVRVHTCAAVPTPGRSTSSGVSLARPLPRCCCDVRRFQPFSEKIKKVGVSLMSRSLAPEGLSARSQRIWESERARTRSQGRLALLEECLRHLDRADALAALIAKEGLTSTTKTTGAVHIHPLAKIELTHRGLFVKLAKMLTLEWHQPLDGRDS